MGRTSQRPVGGTGEGTWNVWRIPTRVGSTISEATFPPVRVFLGGLQTFARVCARPSEKGSIALPADGRCWQEILHTFVHVVPVKDFVFYCMCTRVVTHRAYRLRDISTEIDPHVIGFTGTRLPFHPPWDGSAHESSVAQHGRHFEVGWGYEQTRFPTCPQGCPFL